MCRFFVIFLLFFSIKGICQPPISIRGTASTIVVDKNLFVEGSFKLPTYTDTSAANLAITNKVIRDTFGLQIFTLNDRLIWIRGSNPKSWIKPIATSSTSYRTASSATTLSPSDVTVEVLSGTFNISVPATSVETGHPYEIINNGAGTTTIASTNGKTFNGASSIVVNTGHSVAIRYNGANYTIINQY